MCECGARYKTSCTLYSRSDLLFLNFKLLPPTEKDINLEYAAPSDNIQNAGSGSRSFLATQTLFLTPEL